MLSAACLIAHFISAAHSYETSIFARAPYHGLGPGDTRQFHGTLRFREDEISKPFATTQRAVNVFDEYE